MKFLPQIILELANFHEGKVKKIEDAIRFYNNLEYQNKSIKFQVFKFSKLAVKDFGWYTVYKKLFFNEDNWNKIFKLVANKKIWIDIFDSYSVYILRQNLKLIYGIKLQASVLLNQKLLDELYSIKLDRIYLIINVSGFKISEINKLLKKFKKYNFKKIIIQFGFQNYPTKITDTNLDKLNTFKKQGFKNFSYADHIDANNNFSKVIPLLLCEKGYSIIEKHFCISRKESKYDYYSSLEPQEFLEMIENLKQMFAIKKRKKFLNPNEKKYLINSQQTPVLNKIKYAGSTLKKEDIDFKRSKNKSNLIQINEKIFNNSTLTKNFHEDEVLDKNYIKKRNRVGLFIICRLKSSRLKKKALAKIDGKESIFYVIESCLKLKKIDHIFLATSFLKEDRPLISLIKKKFKNRIKFILGDPNNIIQRIVFGANKYSLDTAIRVTGDCPTISHEIIEQLLKAHLQKGSDMTYAKKFAVGTSGEIYSVGSLREILNRFKKAQYSEYLPFYYYNNEEFFNINCIDLKKEYVRDYRLTLDYEDDLLFYNVLIKKMKKKKLNLNLINIFKILDDNKQISKINSNLPLVYKEKKFILKLNKKCKFDNIK